jgi:hypothetical protein
LVIRVSFYERVTLKVGVFPKLTGFWDWLSLPDLPALCNQGRAAFRDAAFVNKQPAGMEAGCMDSWVFALQKPKAKKWHGGHF